MSSVEGMGVALGAATSSSLLTGNSLVLLICANE